MHIYESVCMCVYTYMDVHMYMCVHVYIHTNS